MGNKVKKRSTRCHSRANANRLRLLIQARHKKLDELPLPSTEDATTNENEMEIEIQPHSSTTANETTIHSERHEDLPDLEIQYVKPHPDKDPKINTLEGRRVVDIRHFITQIRCLDRHSCPVDPRGSLMYQDERRCGLLSHLKFECPYCGEAAEVSTDPIRKKQSGRPQLVKGEHGTNLSLNDAAVWGTVSTGGGHTHLEELFSMIGVPAMTPRTFRKHEAFLGDKWESLLAERMEEAATEEKILAEQQGRMDSGMPWTTAIVDGGWSHRSYGHRYTAKSGCAVIIGFHTKKLLYMGVKNKFCSTCARSSYRGIEPRLHTCYKNWNKPSTAMEAEIIVEGFNFCEAEYGIRFLEYVGDGDSSVLSAIRQNVVTYGMKVQKLECANHVTKNLTKALHTVAKNTKSSKALSTSRINVISKTARRIIYHNRNNPGLIKKDLLNVPDHVFGDHSKCRTDVCVKAGSTGNPKLKKDLSRETLVGIRSAIDRMAGKSHALATNSTSNRAEMYMHLVTKFTGGKQFNRSQQGSYNRRCHAAGLSYQLGAGWRGVTWKAITGKSPSTSVKVLGAKIAKRQASCKKSLFHSVKQRHLNSKKIPETARPQGDEHYGPNALQPDISAEDMEVRCAGILRDLTLTEEQKDQLEIETRDQAESELWWKERRSRLTASNFGMICKMRESTSCKSTVKRLLYNHSLSTDATSYGVQMEGVAIDAYEQETSTTVQKCGIVVDIEHGFLAASPDGLIGSNGILEVKCPYSARDMTPLEAALTIKDFSCNVDQQQKLQLKSSHNYYYQVQGQLHITNREWCDFVVWTSKGLGIVRIVRDDAFWESKMFPKLERFFRCCLLPELADPRFTRKMDIREPDYIVKGVRALLEKKRKQEDCQ